MLSETRLLWSAGTVPGYCTRVLCVIVLLQSCTQYSTRVASSALGVQNSTKTTPKQSFPERSLSDRSVGTVYMWLWETTALSDVLSLKLRVFRKTLPVRYAMHTVTRVLAQVFYKCIGFWALKSDTCCEYAGCRMRACSSWRCGAVEFGGRRELCIWYKKRGGVAISLVFFYISSINANAG